MPAENTCGDALLLSRLALYEHCASAERTRILRAAVHNDLRAFAEDEVSSLRRLMQQEGDWKKLCTAFLSSYGLVLEPQHDVPHTQWGHELCSWSRYLADSGLDQAAQAVGRAVWQVLHGLCPLLNFAFGRWHAPPFTENTALAYQRLAELSVTYLFRLVPVEPAVPFEKSIGQGAYSWIVRHDQRQRSVLKIPRNLAAQAFVNEMEAQAMRVLLDSPLAPHVPPLRAFFRASAVIERDFVEGCTGDHILRSGAALSETQVAALQEFYIRARRASQTHGIALDLHPGNIIWGEQCGRWVLVDLGPVPDIGRDYYPFDDFEHYLQIVWLERCERMRTVPVRSVDIEF